MEIGKQLKEARMSSGLTQEDVADKIKVSRQTISNWENEKSYPDIASVIELSDLYAISLDALLKGDDQMVKHLRRSTNIVSSNKKMIIAITANILLLIGIFISTFFVPSNRYWIVTVFILAITSSSALFYQIVRKF